MKGLATAFKEVYEEPLKERGFQRINMKHPVYARLIVGEIVHVITFEAVRSDELNPNIKAFEIVGGVATVYRGRMYLEATQSSSYMYAVGLGRMYAVRASGKKDENYWDKIYKFHYDKTNEESLEASIRFSYEAVERDLLPELDNACSLEGALDFLSKYKCPLRIFDEDSEFWKGINNHRYVEDEGLLYYVVYGKDKIDNFIGKKMFWQERYIEDWERMFLEGKWRQDVYEAEKNSSKESTQKFIDIYKKFVNTPELMDMVIKKIEEKKSLNQEILRSYGLDI